MSNNSKKPRRKQLSRREYERLKKSAYQYIVEQGMDQKEVAKLLNLTETTISNWATTGNEGKWRDLRASRQQCQSTEADNLRKLIAVLSEQRLELETSINDAIKAGDSKQEGVYRRQASALSDEISKFNKALQTIDKSSYTLGVFIEIMEEIFNTMRAQDEELWEQTIDFQSNLIRRKTNELA